MMNNKIGDVGIVGFDDPLWLQDRIRKEHIAWFETIWTFFERYGANVHTADLFDDWNKLDYILVFRIDYELFHRVSKLTGDVKKIYFAIEPEVVKSEHSPKNIRKLLNLFDIIITPFIDIVDYKRVFPCVVYENLEARYGNIPFDEKKLLVNISGYKKSRNKHELYSERIRLIRWFDEQVKMGKSNGEFDLYGQGKWSKLHSPSYRGQAGDKIELYHHYKFALALENSRGINGYMTEKLFDCFIAGIVPIYAGADNITEYIPESCFINYFDYSSPEELIEFLRAMDENEYAGYIANIKTFLADARATYRWSAKAWNDYLNPVINYKLSDGVDGKTGFNSYMFRLTVRAKVIGLLRKFHPFYVCTMMAEWLNS